VGTVVLTDFSKAFDLIDHTLLVQKFIQLGVRESLISWICSFISNRQQCVRYNQALSDFKTLKGGLPQGTKMGPLGFQAIINDAASEAKSSVWKYVDDLTIAENCTNSTKSNIQQDLNDFVDWSKDNNLTLNPSKCQALQVCFMRNPPQPALSIGNVPLNLVNSAKILGIWIQNDLKWDTHVHEMLKKVNRRLYMLRTLKRFGFNSNELSVVYKGYVRPLLEYGDVVWNSTLTCNQTQQIEKVQKRACKIIQGKNYTSYQDAINACEMVTLSERRQSHCFKFAKSLSECDQTNALIPPTRREVHGRELRNSGHITQLKCRTSRFRAGN
jgi:DNA-binding transcriptional regulator of glucitol operon